MPTLKRVSTLNFYLFAHVVENSGCFECLEVLNIPVYELLNDRIKKPYRSTLRRCTSAFKENLSAGNTNTCNKDNRCTKQDRLINKSAVSEKLERISATGPFFVRDGSRTTVIA